MKMTSFSEKYGASFTKISPMIRTAVRKHAVDGEPDSFVGFTAVPVDAPS